VGSYRAPRVGSPVRGADVSTQTTSMRLEGLKKIVQAARDVKHRYPGLYVDGINAGLDIALRAIDMELTLSRDNEAATAPHQ